MLLIYLGLILNILTQGAFLSPLGTWLHSPVGTSPPERVDNVNIARNNSRQAVILVWKYGSTLGRRHLQRYQKTNKYNNIIHKH